MEEQYSNFPFVSHVLVLGVLCDSRGGRLPAVSYTHLDVYKRQHLYSKVIRDSQCMKRNLGIYLLLVYSVADLIKLYMLMNQ